MNQDTRKDKRAKIVSLNVRYKSATVDEFIENHSHDVSKGGIFIKTPTPFPPGTLLKFEIRIAGDKAVIAGVGRVVWKREPTQAVNDRPAGMGVKFIKIDEPSRVVIDKLVGAKVDAGSAFEDGEPDAAKGGSVPPVGTGSKTESSGMSAAPPRLDLKAGKATMVGIGVPLPPMKKVEPSATASSEPMFPSGPPAEPPKEPTVMKQAAELLEEALKEAGGSMDDIGQNPLFDKAGNSLSATDTFGVAEPKDAHNKVPPAPTTLKGLPAAPANEPVESKSDRPSPLPARESTREKVPPAAEFPVPEARAKSDPPKSDPLKSEPPKSTPPRSSPPRSNPPRSVREPVAATPVQPPPKKGGSMGLVFGLLAVVAIAAGGAYVFKPELFGAQSSQPTESPPQPTSTAPAVSVAPSPMPTSAEPAVTAADAATTASKDAGAADATAKMDSAVAHAVGADTTPAASATGTASTSSPTAHPTATATTAPAKPKPTATATAADTAPAPSPKPKPKPKPVDTSSDNPY